MNVERLVSVFVALACITSLGIASTTLSSSLETDPDDEISFDYEQLPIGRDDASDVQQSVEENEREQREQSSASADASTDSSEDLLEQLLALLKAVLPYLLAAAVLLAAAALVGKYWRRLVAPLLALAPQFDERSDDGRRSWYEREPRDEVERAWFDLLRRAGVERPHAKTPSECAQAAIDAGMDPGAVEGLRRVFEEVRYGRGEMTEEQRRRLDRSRERLGLDGGAGT